MILAVEIGGTKLQTALVDSQGRIAMVMRSVIDRAAGASGILAQIQTHLVELGTESFDRVGVGFGGPVSETGVIYKSHQIAGWDGFNIAQWFTQQTGKPTTVANDCDAAAMGEALWGAGRGVRSMFYVTVGTGVGGGWVVDGVRQGAFRPAIAEIGHLRPGLDCDDFHATVESIASGGGIETRYLLTGRAWFDASQAPHDESPIPIIPKPQAISEADWIESQRRFRELTEHGKVEGRHIAQAANEGDPLAQAVFRHATQVLGWAMAQVATLTAAQRIVVGGGVAKQNDELFWNPIRAAFKKYAFGPLRDETEIVASELGDDVVLVGAAAVAAGI